MDDPGRARRREFLKSALISTVSLATARLSFGQAPAVITSRRMRPQMASGLQICDLLSHLAIVWSRTDRPARLIVEHSSRADFGGAIRVAGPQATAAGDYTTRVDLAGLPADRELFVRASFEDLTTGRTISAPVAGRLHT